MFIRRIKSFLRRMFPAAFWARDARSKGDRRRAIEAILANPTTSSFDGMEEQFDALQKMAFDRYFDYGYDAFSIWSRGADRTRQLLKIG